MSKRKLTNDGRNEESLKKFRETFESFEARKTGVKRKRNSLSHDTRKKPTNKYGCSLHDNDVTICSIYGCSGGQIHTQQSYSYNYIN